MKFKALTVVLREDVNEDDAKSIIDAIGQFKNVISVTGEPVSYEDHVANERAKSELRRRLIEVLL